MDPAPPRFDLAVIACPACGHVDVLDLQRGVCSPERLRRVWQRCSVCGARDLDVTLV